jgi:hypothetical protein
MIWLAQPAVGSLPLHMSETADMMFEKRRRVADANAGSD